MLILSLFFILSAVALPSIPSTAPLLLRTTSLTLLAALALVTNAACWQSVSSGVSLYCGTLMFSQTAVMASAAACGLGSLALVGWAPSWISQTITSYPRIGSYSLFALMTVLGGCLLSMAGSLISVYLALELQSFAVYIIAGIYRYDKKSTQSALIYFMLGGLSSSLILLGTAIVYSQTGVLDLSELAMLLGSDGINTPWAFMFGGVAVAAGLLFKITAAPFHQWGPDVYDGVPTIITAWIAVVPKVSLLILFLNITMNLGTPMYIELTNNVFPVWSTLLLASSLLSLVVGTIVGLAQVRVKRLLAYSTVSHVGFLLLALSIGSQDACAAYLFYVIQYTVTSLLGFLTVLGIGYYTPLQGRSFDIGTIDELRGASSRAPALAACLVLTLFSIAGVPPLVGFFAKQAVLTTAVKAGYLFMSIVGVVTSVISASYYLQMIHVSHFETNNIKDAISSVTALHSYVVSMLTLSLVGFIATPQLVLDASRLMALTLYSV